MKIETYRDQAGEWRWRMKASNGRIIAVSGEGYVNVTDMMDTLMLIRRELPTANIEEVE